MISPNFDVRPYGWSISRYIREAVNDGMIMAFDDEAPKKLMKYVPFWAKSLIDG